jgi:hypothetical protein
MGELLTKEEELLLVGQAQALNRRATEELLRRLLGASVLQRPRGRPKRSGGRRAASNRGVDVCLQ